MVGLRAFQPPRTTEDLTSQEHPVTFLLEYSEQFLQANLQHLRGEHIQPQAKLFDSETGQLLFTCIASLEEGSIFGEKGLDESTPRNATVVCTTNCSFGYLLKADYDICLREINQSDAERRKNFFYREVFHSEILGHTAHRLAFDFYKRKLTLGRGEFIVKQGERSKFVTVVKSGQVYVHREDIEPFAIKQNQFEDTKSSVMHTERRKKRYILSIAGAGELYGEEGLFPNQIPDYNVQVASETAVILQVTYECLRSYFAQDMFVPDFIKKLYISRRKRRETQIKLMKNINQHRESETPSKQDWDFPGGCMFGGVKEAELVQEQRNGFLKRFRLRANDQRLVATIPDLKTGEPEMIRELQRMLSGLPEDKHPTSLSLQKADGGTIHMNKEEIVALKQVDTLLDITTPTTNALSNSMQDLRADNYSPARKGVEMANPVKHKTFRGLLARQSVRGTLSQHVTDVASYHDKYSDPFLTFVRENGPMRGCKIIKMRDAELVISDKLFTLAERANQKKMQQFAFEETQVSLERIQKLHEGLKNFERKDAIKKFNQVLRNQIQKKLRSSNSRTSTSPGSKAGPVSPTLSATKEKGTTGSNLDKLERLGLQRDYSSSEAKSARRYGGSLEDSVLTVQKERPGTRGLNKSLEPQSAVENLMKRVHLNENIIKNLRKPFKLSESFRAHTVGRQSTYTECASAPGVGRTLVFDSAADNSGVDCPGSFVSARSPVALATDVQDELFLEAHDLIEFEDQKSTTKGVSTKKQGPLIQSGLVISANKSINDRQTRPTSREVLSTSNNNIITSRNLHSGTRLALGDLSSRNLSPANSREHSRLLSGYTKDRGTANSRLIVRGLKRTATGATHN